MKKAKVQKTDLTEIDNKISYEAYKEYWDQGHGSQSYERLLERGGFCWAELAVLLYQRIKRIENKQG